jgi:hypothetical protein
MLGNQAKKPGKYSNIPPKHTKTLLIFAIIAAKLRIIAAISRNLNINKN